MENPTDREGKGKSYQCFEKIIFLCGHAFPLYIKVSKNNLPSMSQLIEYFQFFNEKKNSLL